VASGIQFTCLFITGLVVALTYDWRLTLVIVSVMPLIVIAGALFSKLLIVGTTKGQTLYASAGAIADEALTLIRTVVSFGTQTKEVHRFES
jgi:ABC-type multidrug transport system fused ATPase/permease subunit